jgi:hypothetical protein
LLIQQQGSPRSRLTFLDGFKSRKSPTLLSTKSLLLAQAFEHSCHSKTVPPHLPGSLKDTDLKISELLKKIKKKVIRPPSQDADDANVAAPVDDNSAAITADPAIQDAANVAAGATAAVDASITVESPIQDAANVAGAAAVDPVLLLWTQAFKLLPTLLPTLLLPAAWQAIEPRARSCLNQRNQQWKHVCSANLISTKRRSAGSQIVRSKDQCTSVSACELLARKPCVGWEADQ